MVESEQPELEAAYFGQNTALAGAGHSTSDLRTHRRDSAWVEAGDSHGLADCSSIGRVAHGSP